MRTVLRAAKFPVLTALPVITLTAGLFIVACGSSTPREGFPINPAGSDGGSEGGDPNFGDKKKDSGPAPGCATAEAQTVKPPVDFIFTVAQCGSMSIASAGVASNINSLPALLQKSGLDYRVTMIASKTGFAPVCVPTPLAGPGCGNNGNTFRLVNQHIESGDTTKLVMSTLAATSGDTQWADFLRPEALKVFVMTTDEDAYDLKAPQFDAALLAVPGSPFGTPAKRNYVVYPIIGANPYPQTSKCPGASQTGAEYQTLATNTGGKWYPVCSANFATVLADIALTVNAQVACSLGIPTVPGQTLDPANVNVKIKAPDGTVTDILKDANKDCAAGANGWQYSADGKTILLCGTACDDVKANPEAKVSVEFGCQSKVK